MVDFVMATKTVSTSFAPITHAIAQVGRWIKEGKIIPDPHGRWVLLCNGAPSDSAEVARSSTEATCTGCIDVLKSAGVIKTSATSDK